MSFLGSTLFMVFHLSFTTVSAFTSQLLISSHHQVASPARSRHQFTCSKLLCETVVYAKGTVGPEDESQQPLDNGRDSENESDGNDTPYRNRSLSWSNRFRRLFPYETTRLSVIELGLRSKEEWDEYVADGKVYHGAYLPNHPDQMYPGDWVSWDDFLGLMRPMEEAQDLVQNVLKIHTLEEYRRFIKMDKKRAEGLRIPARPDIVYRGKGWISEDSFFGTFS